MTFNTDIQLASDCNQYQVGLNRDTAYGEEIARLQNQFMAFVGYGNPRTRTNGLSRNECFGDVFSESLDYTSYKDGDKVRPAPPIFRCMERYF